MNLIYGAARLPPAAAQTVSDHRENVVFERLNTNSVDQRRTLTQ